MSQIPGIGPAPAPPTLFVSSTYFDLSSIRQELEHFLAELGYVPILFESAAPLPGVAAPASAVRQAGQADVCILIVGNRYGTVDESSGLSWTHLEFRTARDLGKPVFAFVAAATLVQFDLWQSRLSSGFWKPDEEGLFRFLGEVSAAGSRYPFTSLPDLKYLIRQHLAAYFGYLLRKYGQLEVFTPVDDRGWRQLGRSLFRRGELPAARLCFRRALDLNPTDRHARRHLISCHYWLGRLEEGLEEALEAHAQHPGTRGFLVQLVALYLALKRPESAVQYASKLTEVFPNDDRSWSAIAVCFKELGRSEEAIVAARRSVELFTPRRGRNAWYSDFENEVSSASSGRDLPLQHPEPDEIEDDESSEEAHHNEERD